MKKRGFTLIELLAVIVVLAIIALITIPIISDVIVKTKKTAVRNSAYGILDTMNLYYARNSYSSGTVFTCDGKTCETENGSKLSLKGTTPKSGEIIAKTNNEHELHYLVIGDYCVLGTRRNLDVQKDCSKLDITKPELNVSRVNVTSKSITLNVKTEDNETGIKQIKYEIQGKTYIDKYSKLSVDVNKTFNDLQDGKNYTIKVTVTNGNGLIQKSEIDVETISMGILKIKFNNLPEELATGYYQSQEAYFEYDGTIETKGYYIKSERAAISNVELTKSCGNENSPSECNNIEGTTNMEANTWYYVEISPIITYNTDFAETSTLYARITDGFNITANTTATISKIDTIPPTASLSINGTAINDGYASDSIVSTVCSDAGSGISSKTENQILTVGGDNDVSGTCIDNAGNSSEASASYKIYIYSADEVCGYNSCPAPACGVAYYNYCQNAACGSTTNSCETPACGVLYWNSACGVQFTCNCPPYGCGPHQYYTCQNPACGSTVNSCRTPGCGVGAYNTCATAACGYATCWHV